jgi:hypothetical protein
MSTFVASVICLCFAISEPRSYVKERITPSDKDWMRRFNAPTTLAVFLPSTLTSAIGVRDTWRLIVEVDRQIIQ